MKTSLLYYVQKLDRLTFFRQTLFGLSWMLATSLLVLGQNRNIELASSVTSFFYLLVAFFAARTAGMCLNRLIDRFIDAQNPRTRDRPLQKGEVSVQFIFLQVSAFLLLFFYAALKLGTLSFVLSCLVGVLLCAYSYLKRFTTLCHFGLGFVHMLVPVACWAAFTKTLGIEPFFLGLSLLCSIAAGDIIYACQDVEFDRSHDLKSIPAWLGIRKALDLAKFLHCLAVLFLLLFTDFFREYKLLLLASLAVAYVYYSAYRKLEKEGFEKSFSYANTFSGLVFFLFVFVESVWHVL